MLDIGSEANEEENNVASIGYIESIEFSYSE